MSAVLNHPAAPAAPSAALQPSDASAASAGSGAQAATLSDRIRPHLAEFAKQAAATEAARMVSPAAIEKIKEAGFFRALVPRRYGGEELSIAEFCDAVRLIASACPSTAWVTGVLCVHAVGIPHMDQRVQDEIWAGGPDTVVSSSGSPIIRATLVDGGVRVTGAARWSSGCDHATWAMIGVKVPDVSNKRYAETRFTDYFVLVPQSDYTINDTWYSTGMRGSGSKDLVLDDVFVPHYRMDRIEALAFGYGKGAGLHEGWMQKVPFAALFGVFLPAVALGCADGMVSEFRKRQVMRKNNYTGGKTINSRPGYMRLAESVHELEATGLYYTHQLQQMERHGREGRRANEEVFIEMIARFPYVTNRAVETIDRLFEAAGASAIADFNPMQRFWRDGHTAALHLGSDYDIQRQMHGRTMMGLMMDPDL